jgi:hypothetical protein
MIMALSMSGPVSAGSAPAYGTVKPFNLGLQALMAKSGVTDLYLNVTSRDNAVAVPSSLNKIQLKSYQSDGKLAYTRNLMNTSSPGGQAAVPLTDVTRYQPLKTQVNVKTSQTVNEEILEATTKVLYRPDLTVDKISAPSEAYTNAAFPVNVTVKELNGDIGATSTVRILNGAATLDTVGSLNVPAGSSAGAAFMLTLSTPGTYTLTVDIGNVVPGDYDYANNQATFTVTVVNPNKPVSYYSYYNQGTYSSNYDRTDWSGGLIESYRNSGRFENFYVGAFTSDAFTPAGTLDVTLKSETGATKSLHLTGISNNSWQYFPDSNSYIWTSSSPGWGTSFNLYSDSGQWTYSSNWYGYFSTSSSTYGLPIMGAQQTVSVLLDMPSTDGTHYGGNYAINLNHYPYSWDYQYNDWWYWWWGGQIHEWGFNDQYSGWSSGTTSW